jgi:hypothetical protein
MLIARGATPVSDALRTFPVESSLCHRSGMPDRCRYRFVTTPMPIRADPLRRAA